MQKQQHYSQFVQPLQVGKPLELTKSKSDYVYTKDQQYYPQQIQQKSAYLSPYLGPTSKEVFF